MNPDHVQLEIVERQCRISAESLRNENYYYPPYKIRIHFSPCKIVHGVFDDSAVHNYAGEKFLKNSMLCTS